LVILFARMLPSGFNSRREEEQTVALTSIYVLKSGRRPIAPLKVCFNDSISYLFIKLVDKPLYKVTF
jgi:hypothetical protein